MNDWIHELYGQDLDDERHRALEATGSLLSVEHRRFTIIGEGPEPFTCHEEEAVETICRLIER